MIKNLAKSLSPTVPSTPASWQKPGVKLLGASHALPVAFPKFEASSSPRSLSERVRMGYSSR